MSYTLPIMLCVFCGVGAIWFLVVKVLLPYIAFQTAFPGSKMSLTLREQLICGALIENFDSTFTKLPCARTLTEADIVEMISELNRNAQAADALLRFRTSKDTAAFIRIYALVFPSRKAAHQASQDIIPHNLCRSKPLNYFPVA